MSKADEDLVNCLWTQIEYLLSLPPEERDKADIYDVSLWFRNRSSLFHSIDESRSNYIFFFLI